MGFEQRQQLVLLVRPHLRGMFLVRFGRQETFFFIGLACSAAASASEQIAFATLDRSSCTLERTTDERELGSWDVSDQSAANQLKEVGLGYCAVSIVDPDLSDHVVQLCDRKSVSEGINEVRELSHFQMTVVGVVVNLEDLVVVTLLRLCEGNLQTERWYMVWCMARQGKARQGKARQGKAKQGRWRWRGVVWRGMSCSGEATSRFSL